MPAHYRKYTEILKKFPKNQLMPKIMISLSVFTQYKATFQRVDKLGQNPLSTQKP